MLLRQGLARIKAANSTRRSQSRPHAQLNSSRWTASPVRPSLSFRQGQNSFDIRHDQSLVLFFKVSSLGRPSRDADFPSRWARLIQVAALEQVIDATDAVPAIAIGFQDQVVFAIVTRMAVIFAQQVY